MKTESPLAGRKLTPRELQVLGLICEGLSTKEIAVRLSIQFKTAACHRGRLLEKSGTQKAILLYRWALLNGYVSLEDGGQGVFQTNRETAPGQK